MLLVSTLGCGTHKGGSVPPDLSYASAFSRSTAALIYPEAKRGLLVLDDGSITNGLWHIRFRFEASQRAASPGGIAYEDRWLPIAHWTRLADSLSWEFEAIAFPARFPGDSVLAVSLEARVSNPHEVARDFSFGATIDSLVGREAFVAPWGDVPQEAARVWARSASSESACGWTDMTSAGDTASVRSQLGPHQIRSIRFVLPTHELTPSELVRIARSSHASLRERVRKDWRDRMARGISLQLNDPETERAVMAATSFLLCCQEKYGQFYYPTGGPFQYHDVWLRDGARIIAALSVTGFTHEARRLAEGVLSLQLPQGLFLTQRGQLDGTGQALWSFEAALLRPTPDTALVRFSRSAVRAVEWAEAQRKLGGELGCRFSRMLPTEDPRDNELVNAQLVGNDAWMLAGYEAAVRLCDRAGLADNARRIEGLRAVYLREFEGALLLTGSADLPPSWQGVGRDWGNVAVAWPTRTLSPQHSRCERLATRMWQFSRGAGLVAYASPDSLHAYLGGDLGIWALLSGHVAEADSVLTAMLYWRDGTGSGAEVFSRSTRDFGLNFPPHPTFAAALVQQVRNSLVYDDADTLMLTLGARRTWWRGSDVRRAPTRWGLMDLSFRLQGGVAHWKWTPVPVPTVIRMPPGTQFTEDRPPGRPYDDSRHWLVLPANQSEASVRVRDENAATH